VHSKGKNNLNKMLKKLCWDNKFIKSIQKTLIINYNNNNNNNNFLNNKFS
jgi:hypothetical protein